MRGVEGSRVASTQPFVVAGSGTLAMEMAACNVTSPGDHVVLVHTGYFSERMAEMLRRRGVEIHAVVAPLGDAPSITQVEAAFDASPWRRGAQTST